MEKLLNLLLSICTEDGVVITKDLRFTKRGRKVFHCEVWRRDLTMEKRRMLVKLSKVILCCVSPSSICNKRYEGILFNIKWGKLPRTHLSITIYL